MAPIPRNIKVGLDVAADQESGDSISFSGFVCIQDQQPGKEASSLMKEQQADDDEFEFSRTVPNDRSNSSSNEPPISPGRMKLRDFLCQKMHSQVTQSPPDEEVADIVVLCNDNDKKKQLEKKNNTIPEILPHRNERNKVTKKSKLKFLQSFFKPFQDCRPRNSAVKSNDQSSYVS
ncbi:hypothetical protein LINPERHAP1_LOCUS25969 [Linum perenne]